MGRNLFQLDVVPDPREEIVESIIQPTGKPPVGQESVIPPVPGGRSLFTLDPKPTPEPTILETVGRGLRGQAELGLTVGTSIALEPFAGVSGIIMGMFSDEPDAARKSVEFVRNFAFKPGPAGQEVARGIGEIAETLTPDIVLRFAKAAQEDIEFAKEDAFQKYGPFGGTAVAIALPAVLEGVAGYAAIKNIRKLGTTRADEAIQETEDALRELGVDTKRIDIQPEDKTLRQITEDFDKQDTQNLIDAIKPDEEILQSAKNLGVDINPSHFSNNQAFIAMEQGLKSRPDNKLRQIENDAIEKLGNEADQLILDLEGSIDKGLLDTTIKKKFTTVIDQLQVKSNNAYEVVNKKIPRDLPVIPGTSRIFIEKRIADLGGDESLLNKSEKQLRNIIFPKAKPGETISDLTPITPSYGALDQVRRNVGNAIEKKTGPYRDDEELILDQVYGVLSNEQQGIADVFGVGPVYEQGRKLVKLRKDIEKKSLDLFGRNLENSLIPKLGTAAVNITKGDISTFQKLVKALPPSQRQAAVATMLNSFFTMGARTGGPLGGGFVGAFEALNRNPSIKKTLFSELPPEAVKRFDDIGRVTTGLFRSKALQNNSGTANALLANLDNGSIANKILKSRRLASPFSKFGRALSFTAAFLTRVLPKKTKVAADFLTSPEFKKSLENAALGNTVTAERVIKTRKFNDWFVLLDDDVRNRITTIGFIPWLLEEEDGDIVNIEVSTEELRRRRSQ